MDKNTFGTTLRSLRERKGLTIKQVLEELKKYGKNIRDNRSGDTAAP